MPKVEPHERCLQCNGVGLMRSDDPLGDKVYGDYCTYCNGTGMASNPAARRWAVWLFIVLNVLATVIWLKACT